MYITNKNGQQISPYHDLIGDSLLFRCFPVSYRETRSPFTSRRAAERGKVTGPTTVLSGPPQPVIQQTGVGELQFRQSRGGGWIRAGPVRQQCLARVGNFGGRRFPEYFHAPAAFHAGDQISCAMTVCGVLGKPTPPVTVALEPPQQPILMEPPTGADDEFCSRH